MATPVLWGSQLPITNAPGGQGNPQITALKDGTFVSVWTDSSGAVPVIRGQIFNADGTKKGEGFLVSDSSSVGQNFPTITVLNDGRFAVAWASSVSTTDNNVKAQIFSANGVKSGGELIVNPWGTAGFQTMPSIAALGNGGFVVAFNSENRDGSSFAVCAQAFDAYGNHLGRELIVNETTSGLQVDPYVLGLGDRYAVFYSDDSKSADDPDSTIRGRILSQDGREKEAEFLVPVLPGQRGSPSAALLTDGRYVVTWMSTEGDGSFNCIKAQIFNPDGSRSNGEFLVNAITINYQVYPVVTALHDGGFAIAYMSSNGGADASKFYLAAFDAAGQRQGAEDLLLGQSAGSLPQITTLTDGRILVTWESRTISSDPATGDIAAQIVDPRSKAVSLNGTGFNDQYIGTSFNDVLKGAAGNDSLRGEVGSDKLWGGAGTDVLTGGAGKDAFVFNATLNKLTNVDTITDFSVRDDTIHLENAYFRKLAKTGVLNKAFLKVGTKAGDGDDHIVYNKGTGVISYDADGSGKGAAVAFAKVKPGTALTYADFLVI